MIFTEKGKNVICFLSIGLALLILCSFTAGSYERKVQSMVVKPSPPVDLPEAEATFFFSDEEDEAVDYTFFCEKHGDIGRTVMDVYFNGDMETSHNYYCLFCLRDGLDKVFGRVKKVPAEGGKADE